FGWRDPGILGRVDLVEVLASALRHGVVGVEDRRERAIDVEPYRITAGDGQAFAEPLQPLLEPLGVNVRARDLRDRRIRRRLQSVVQQAGVHYRAALGGEIDRKSTRLNSSHV